MLCSCKCVTFLPFVKKGDLTVIRNFENTIVLKVKIMKKPKVEAASYNRVFGQNFQFKNLKEMSLKNQCVSYNWVRLITEKIWYFILWKSSSNHIYNQYPPLNWQYPPSLGNPQAFDHPGVFFHLIYLLEIYKNQCFHLVLQIIITKPWTRL